MPGLRKVCLTKNNYTTADYSSYVEHIQQFCVYGIIGREVAKTGTKHLQMYVEYKSARRFATLAKIYEGAHIEAKKGTNQQAADYCKKEGDYTEFGTFTPEAQGQRNDLKLVAEAIKDNNGIIEMVEDNIVCNKQQLDFAEKLMKYFEPGREEPPDVWWLWGPPEVGKSRRARELCKGMRTWISPGNLQWFDGYDGHEAAIIDDFRPDQCSFVMLLRLLDRYEFKVPIKGGFRQWKPKRIIITTPKRITETFQGWDFQGENLKQINRRVTWEREVQSGDT